jgi:putative transposase
MNRATARQKIFADDADYLAFERVLAEARQRVDGAVRVCAYVVMPNHFHLVLWPKRGQDTAVSAMMKWLTLTHAQRWHAHRHSAGTGALYGARFKSFPVRTDGHFLKVCRYVERNPVRANLVQKAEHWQWCSLHKRLAATNSGLASSAPQEDKPGKARPTAADLLDQWPVPPPRDWLQHVNQAQTATELDALRRCVRRGRPYGDQTWVINTAERLGLMASLHPLGRPPKQTKPVSA